MNRWQEKTKVLLEQLVNTPSVNPRDNELIEGEANVAEKLIEYVKENIPEAVIETQPVLNDRYNVVIKYEVSDNLPTVLLESHLDTVEVDQMIIEPFKMTEKDQKWWGRGVCDAKGQLASMIIGLEKAISDNKPLSMNVIIAAVVDEEHLHRGVDELVNLNPKADFSIVGEPTKLRLGGVHKGSIRFKIETSGIPAHSATPWDGENAIYSMSDIIQCIKSKVVPEVEKKVHPLIGPSSVSVNLISGGEQVNAVPGKCEIHVDRRLNPGENWEEAYVSIKETLKRELTDATYSNTVFKDPYLIDPALDNELDDLNIQEFQTFLSNHHLNSDVIGLPFGCDASKVVKAITPTIVFGPGSIEQAHTKDEFIEIEQIMKAVHLYADFMCNGQLKQ
ncbi:M20/M25/M40 family metallo-hydrolase [Bacillus shivajii]|uniref:M20 family metallopeptidase n=1 Tax=Bacillus shivajii TaxID=1983719 RepID=UPI001CFC3976|nr:M20/M25/M40 family metallo-hydrolase [Bacillus shivajii]UCZ52886.1 M20/M25/M40 family metallo-hydrolase [Bacillus shivajii]